MKIRKLELMSSIFLFIVWIFGLVIFPENYKALEVILFVSYVYLILVISITNTIYGEITLFCYTYGIFLCSYPIMDLFGMMDITNNNFFLGEGFTAREISIAINALIITIIAIIFAYGIWAEKNDRFNFKCTFVREAIDLPVLFRIVFYVVFAFVLLYRLGEFVGYQAAGTYLSLFAENATINPFSRLSFMTTVFDVLFFIVLANPPEQTKVNKYMAAFIIASIPQFMIGRRGPVLIDILFVMWYYSIFVKKIKVRYFIIPTAGLMFLANAIGNIRNNKTVDYSINFITDFFQQQGVSFDVVASTVKYFDTLKASNTVDVPYFLGMAHKYLVYLFDRLTFQNSVFGHGQTLTALHDSSYLGWKLTYIISPSQYLMGRGTGSSFVAENFMTFKYVGCFVLTVLMIALVLKVKQVAINKESVYMRVFYFILVRALFYTPRNDFWIFISDLLTAWMVLIVMNFVLPRVFIKTNPLDTL